MPEVVGIDKLFSIIPKKKFGCFNQYGTSQYGESVYGEEDIFVYFTGYGTTTFGVDLYANILKLSGIYRANNATGTVRYYRMNYYFPRNPRTPAQQFQRQKIALGVLGWQSLTTEEKAVYNKRAIGKRMSGYNLFLREYLLSF